MITNDERTKMKEAVKVIGEIAKKYIGSENVDGYELALLRSLYLKASSLNNDIISIDTRM